MDASRAGMLSPFLSDSQEPELSTIRIHGYITHHSPQTR
jgi:hypothetical protein